MGFSDATVIGAVGLLTFFADELGESLVDGLGDGLGIVRAGLVDLVEREASTARFGVVPVGLLVGLGVAFLVTTFFEVGFTPRFATAVLGLVDFFVADCA
jgi:hypothetical protein